MPALLVIMRKGAKQSSEALEGTETPVSHGYVSRDHSSVSAGKRWGGTKPWIGLQTGSGQFVQPHLFKTFTNRTTIHAADNGGEGFERTFWWHRKACRFY